MSGTPGRAAFEAYAAKREAHVHGLHLTPWDDQTENAWEAWEAAAQAVIGVALTEEREHGHAPDLIAERHALRTELDRARDDFHFERKQVVAMRRVLGEIFTCLDAKDPALLDDEQVTEWRERSGVEPEPAIVTAGTEHLAAQLAERERA